MLVSCHRYNCSDLSSLQLGSLNGLQAANSDLSARLSAEVGNVLGVGVDNKGVSAGTNAETLAGQVKGNAIVLGELGVGVRGENHSGQFVNGTQFRTLQQQLAPSVDDERVVGAQHNQRGDVLVLLQRSQVVQVWGNVVLGTGGGKGAWDGNKQDVAAGVLLEQLVQGQVNGSGAGQGIVARDLRQVNWHIGEYNAGWEGRASRESHFVLSGS